MACIAAGTTAAGLGILADMLNLLSCSRCIDGISSVMGMTERGEEM
jgi:hypothetical protein